MMKILIQILVLGLLISLDAFATPLTVYKGDAKFIVKPDQVDAFKAAVAKIIIPTRNEPGSISYEAFQVMREGKLTNEFEFHEIWKSEQAMMVDHIEKAPHMKEFFETIRLGAPDSMIESFEAQSHKAMSLEPNKN